MKQEIWKYVLHREDSQSIAMPVDSTVLSVGMQCGQVCMWAIGSPDAEKRNRRISIIGTGHPVQPSPHRRFIGTVQDGPFVWHVFEDTF